MPNESKAITSFRDQKNKKDLLRKGTYHEKLIHLCQLRVWTPEVLSPRLHLRSRAKMVMDFPSTLSLRSEFPLLYSKEYVSMKSSQKIWGMLYIRSKCSCRSKMLLELVKAPRNRSVNKSYFLQLGIYHIHLSIENIFPPNVSY